MKRLLIVVFLLLGIVGFSEILLVYQGFGYVLGTKSPASSSFSIELPRGAWIEPGSIIISGVPEGTKTRYLPEDDLKSLYDRNVGKEIIWNFEDGRSERMLLIDPTPVLRDSEGNLFYAPRGQPVFMNETFRGNALLSVEMPKPFTDEVSYTYRVDGATWMTRYAFRWIDDQLHVTGNIVVNLSFSPEDREIMLVSANLGMGKAVTRSLVLADFESVPEVVTTDMRVYRIEPRLTEGTNILAYVSRYVDAEKRYVLRGSSVYSTYSGLDIDILIDELPVDLAPGSVEIWDEGFLSGFTSIDNLVKGDSVRLSGVAKSIELQGRKTTILESTDPSAYEYSVHYWIKNLSDDSHEVIIDDRLPRGAQDIMIQAMGKEYPYEAPSDTPDRLTLNVIVGGEDVEYVRVTYTVRR